jgi:hypothetical protein
MHAPSWFPGFMGALSGIRTAASGIRTRASGIRTIRSDSDDLWRTGPGQPDRSPELLACYFAHAADVRDLLATEHGRVARASRQDLERRGRRIVTAASLDDVFDLGRARA